MNVKIITVILLMLSTSWFGENLFAERKNQKLEDMENKIEMALKEYAEKKPRLKEILKHIGLS